MPTLVIRNLSRQGIPLGRGIGTIGPRHTKEFDTSSINLEELKGGLDKLKAIGKIEYWMDTEHSLREDVESRKEFLDQEVQGIKSLRKDLAASISSTLQTLARVEQSKLVSYARPQLMPIPDFAVEAPRSGHWLLYVEAEVSSPTDAIGELHIFLNEDVVKVRKLYTVNQTFFMTQLFQGIGKDQKVSIRWRSLDGGSLRIEERSLTLLQVAT